MMASSDGDSRPELWLSDDEVRALTNKKQAKAQCRVLDEAGYGYIMNQIRLQANKIKVFGRCAV